MFKDRRDAGRQLASLLQKYKGQDVIVYGLPRGGVVTAEEVAKELGAHLDIILAKKVGHPGNPEYALCATVDLEDTVCSEYETELSESPEFQQLIRDKVEEIKQKEQLFTRDIKRFDPQGKIVIIVDDGVATGLTVKAAIKHIKKKNPQKIIVAVGVSPKDTADILRTLVDEVVVADEDSSFAGAVGAYFEDFSQTEDDEVIEILKRFQN